MSELKYNVNMPNSDLMMKLSAGQIDAPTAKGILNTAELERSQNIKFLVMPLILGALFAAALLLHVSIVAEIPDIVKYVIGAAIPISSIVRGFRISVNTQYINAAKHAHSSSDMDNIEAEDGAWGKSKKIERERATINLLLDRIRKTGKSQIILFSVLGTIILLLGILSLIFITDRSNKTLLISGIVSTIGIINFIAVGAINWRRSGSRPLRALNAYCEKTENPTTTMSEIERQLGETVRFEDVYFCKDYLVLTVNLHLRVYPIDRVASAQFHQQQGYRGAATSYYLRLRIHDVKKPIDAPMDSIKVQEAVTFTAENYPKIKIEAPLYA